MRSIICFCLLIFFVHLQAFSQEISTIAYKDGFILINSKKKCVYMDTTSSNLLPSIPTLLVIMPNRVLGIDGCGQIYMSFVFKEPITKPAFVSKACVGLFKPRKNFTVTPNHLSYFISVDDGYFKKKTFKLIELDLNSRHSRVVDSGNMIDNVYYDVKLNILHYKKDGFNKACQL